MQSVGIPMVKTDFTVYVEHPHAFGVQLLRVRSTDHLLEQLVQAIHRLLFHALPVVVYIQQKGVVPFKPCGIDTDFPAIFTAL